MSTTVDRPPAPGAQTGASPRWRALDPVPYAGGAGIGVVGIVVMVLLGGSYNGLTFATALGYGVVVVGMVVQIGYSHQLAFSQSAFTGVGAYASALLETKYNLGVAPAILSALALSALVAFVSGWFITRAPGLALPLATLLLPLILYQLATFSGYLGTFTGINGVLPVVAGADYASTLTHSGIAIAVILGIVSFLAWRVLRSGVGLQLAALARDERMAEGLGVSLRQRKLELFVFGSVLSALGGALVASVQSIVTPDIVSESAELTLLVMLFIGGRRSIPAAIAGAIGIEWLSTRQPSVSSNLLIVEGALLLVVLLVEPEGLAGLIRLAAAQVQALLARRRAGASATVEAGR